MKEWNEIKNGLPVKNTDYRVMRYGVVSKALYVGSNRWLVPDNNYPKSSELQGITHFQEIPIPEPPRNIGCICDEVNSGRTSAGYCHRHNQDNY